MVGGCLKTRFAMAALPRSYNDTDKLPKAKALNGTKPARTNRDPRFIKRKRKALTP